MPDEAPEVTPPSKESVAAAQQVPATPPPAPEPEPELEPIPEGDSFDRTYVEKLRGENAKWRTRARDIEAPFESYQPEERARFLKLVEEINSDPEAALVSFEGISDRLRKQLGKAAPVPDEVTPPVVPDPEVAPPVGEPAAALTAADVTKIVADTLATERQAQSAQDEVAATLAEAESIDDRYKDPVAKAQLFAAAQTNNTDLAGAHVILTGSFDEQVEAAVQQRLADLASGKIYPPNVGTGEAGAKEPKGPPKTIAEASAAADARLAAAQSQQL